MNYKCDQCLELPTQDYHPLVQSMLSEVNKLASSAKYIRNILGLLLRRTCVIPRKFKEN